MSTASDELRLPGSKIALESDTIRFHARLPFHAGWNDIPGVAVVGNVVTIEPKAYFERLEQRLWRYVPWHIVKEHWDALTETSDVALEQACLLFIQRHARTTDDPATVLANAEEVYTYLFDGKRLAAYEDLHVDDRDLRVLRESSVLCALNSVTDTGRISNIGPAWYFAQCARVVFKLSPTDEARVDELFHGGFFNGPRLRDQLRAHVAMAGKLVHGCQSSGHGSGGCVVSYGTNVEFMQEELMRLRPRFLALFERLSQPSMEQLHA